MLCYFVAFCVLSLGYSGLVVSTSVRGWKETVFQNEPYCVYGDIKPYLLTLLLVIYRT